MAKKIVKAEVKEYTACCMHCGAMITDEQKFVAEGKNYCANCAILQKEKEPALAVPSGIVKWLAYLVSFAGPLAGFVLGLVYSSQRDKTSRDFGRHCFIVMGISLALIFFFLMISLILGIIGIGEEYTGLNIMEGYY